MSPRVEVRLFARLREVCGSGRLRLDLAEGADARACFERVVGEHPAAAALREGLAVAVNEEFAAWERVLRDGDVVSFIPPVSGGRGAGEARFRVTASPVSAAALRPLVASAEAGAVVTFEGTVRARSRGRSVSYLEYEAYAPMAERVFAAIAAAAAARWPIGAMAIHHRVGRLQVGEVSVAIAVAAAHRADAFAACRYAIDELKRSAPIWKREVGPGGAAWVEGPLARPPGQAPLPGERG